MYSSLRQQPGSTLFPYTTLFRSRRVDRLAGPRCVARDVAEHRSELRARDADEATGALALAAHAAAPRPRSEEHTSELQSRLHRVCRLPLEKKNKLRV